MTTESGQIHGAWERLNNDLALQHWPSACLYVVATPIGNMADISPRALYTLNSMDIIAAEDTRSSRVLLKTWGIQTPLMSAHKHNEREAAADIIERLKQGQKVALISDAGAPAVSDPGAKIVNIVRQAGFQVTAIPGASALINALMMSGVTSDENPAFVFAGFAPNKSLHRKQWVQKWSSLAVPVVMFESPHRVLAFCEDMLAELGPTRELTIARELTKRFEQCVSLPLGEVAAWFAQDKHRQQGEFVLILSALEKEQSCLDEASESLLKALLPLLSVRDCVKVVHQQTGQSKDQVYDRALALKASLDQA